MSTDDTREIPVTTDGECPACGSGFRSEAYYVPGSTGMPVTCTSDWHDEDAAGPGAPGPAAGEGERGCEAALVSLRAPAPRCGGCGELFAGTLTATGTSPLFDGALHAGARTAGWAQTGGRWTCSVCLAGITGPLYGPEREPLPSLPVPDSDPLDQSLIILAEADARVPGWWDETNRRNNSTAHKNTLRFGDGLHGFAAMFSRAPDLKSDAEAAENLRRYEAELAERAEAMHRASLERLEQLRTTPSALHLKPVAA